ncbi:MAG: dTDP-4-amino-4,6-dideoxygalactose transaminase [Sulfuricurvum sp.]|nr:dTDP-4-amino-4,6-dideoxygalactose transaminase [Sulfuricurvum sp.]
MIRFNKPYMTGKELLYIAQAHNNSVLAGNGEFTKKCEQWLTTRTGVVKSIITHSCTGALEMAALLADLQPGDEVIMPSYTFVSTANAVVLRGAIPVFVDIRPDTLNIDEKLIEQAITKQTKAIVPVHYAGVSCEMDTIMDIATRHNLWVIEDAAQGVMSTYKGKALGSIGHFGAYSFHETKNIISGEGGALLVRDAAYANQAEIVWEKGTDRSQFFRGEVDKYTWQTVGSSFLPGEVTTAFLWAQMEEAETITKGRLNIWNRYHMAFSDLEDNGLCRRPIIPNECQHNAHMYYLLLPSAEARDATLSKLKQNGVGAIFHYIPLHSSPGGMRYTKMSGQLIHTDNLSRCIVRLPLWYGMTEEMIEQVISTTQNVLKDVVSKV